MQPFCHILNPCMPIFKALRLLIVPALPIDFHLEEMYVTLYCCQAGFTPAKT